MSIPTVNAANLVVVRQDRRFSAWRVKTFLSKYLGPDSIETVIMFLTRKADPAHNTRAFVITTEPRYADSLVKARLTYGKQPFICQRATEADVEIGGLKTYHVEWACEEEETHVEETAEEQGVEDGKQEVEANEVEEVEEETVEEIVKAGAAQGSDDEELSSPVTPSGGQHQLPLIHPSSTCHPFGSPCTPPSKHARSAFGFPSSPNSSPSSSPSLPLTSFSRLFLYSPPTSTPSLSPSSVFSSLPSPSPQPTPPSTARLLSSGEPAVLLTFLGGEAVEQGVERVLDIRKEDEEHAQRWAGAEDDFDPSLPHLSYTFSAYPTKLYTAALNEGADLRSLPTLWPPRTTTLLTLSSDDSTFEVEAGYTMPLDISHAIRAGRTYVQLRVLIDEDVEQDEAIEELDEWIFVLSVARPCPFIQWDACFD